MSASDTISIVGLRVRGHHGALALERRDGQEFVVDVDLRVDARPAARADDLALTVDYGRLAAELAQDVASEPVDLLETLADRLAVRCLAAGDQVVVAQVRVTKPAAPVDVPVAGVAVTVRRQRLRAAVALGSNLGDRAENLAVGLAGLDTAPGVRLREVSEVWQTTPVGGPPGQDPYLNLVATCDVASAKSLHVAARAAEAAAGRTRADRWGPRTLDVDLLAVGEERWATEELTLPHPRAHERAFVLAPWAELEPDRALHGSTVGTLAAQVPRDGVTRRTDVQVSPRRLLEQR